MILVLDPYGVVLLLALSAVCITRPHVVYPDGNLRIPYGPQFGLAVPQAAVASVRGDRRYPEGRLMTLFEDGGLRSGRGQPDLGDPGALNHPLPRRRPARAGQRTPSARLSTQVGIRRDIALGKTLRSGARPVVRDTQESARGCHIEPVAVSLIRAARSGRGYVSIADPSGASATSVCPESPPVGSTAPSRTLAACGQV